MLKHTYFAKIKTCTKCIMDTSDPDIVFDENGECNHCKRAEHLFKLSPLNLNPEERKAKLDILVKKIKSRGRKKRYDCIIGVSGGVDSSYTAYKVKELGLRPLAVHLDNGWDSELSVKNIENICKKLNIDLYTYVIVWEEFKDLQLSFLKASTPDSEIPSDHAIFSTLYKIARKHKVKYILAGNNLATESILPRSWSRGASDWKYIKNIQKKYGLHKLVSFPHYNLLDLTRYKVLKSPRLVSFLDYFDYDRAEAKKILINVLKWKDYGSKHFESLYTKFFQAYILPTKFGFDKRRAHLSSLICAGKTTREEALKEMKNELYSPVELEEDMKYVISKLGITQEEFNRKKIEKHPESSPDAIFGFPRRTRPVVYYRFPDIRPAPAQ